MTSLLQTVYTDSCRQTTYIYKVFKLCITWYDEIEKKTKHAQRYSVVPSRNYSCHGNATIPSLFIVGVDVAVNTMKVFSVPMVMQQWALLHCCPATKYFILLLTILSIKYYECVSVFLSSLSGMQIASSLRCIILLSLVYLAIRYFSTLSHKGHDFRKKLLNIKLCFDFLYNFCLKHFSF
jgi:hypothetical protein